MDLLDDRMQRAPDGYFLSGTGKVEWFQDFEGGPEMVVVPAGSFMMGSPDSEPSHIRRQSWRRL